MSTNYTTHTRPHSSAPSHTMSDPRRGRRPDSRQMWDDTDRRDRHAPRDGDRDGGDRDRRGGGDRRSYRSRSRDRRGQRDRSRSPDRRPRDRDQGGRGGRAPGDVRGRGGSSRFEERERRDRRWKEDDDRDRRGTHTRSSLVTIYANLQSRTQPRHPPLTLPASRQSFFNSPNPRPRRAHESTPETRPAQHVGQRPTPQPVAFTAARRLCHG